MLQGREGNVIAGVAACIVGAMTSSPLLVIKYTHGQTDRMTNLLISSNSLRSSSSSSTTVGSMHVGV